MCKVHALIKWLSDVGRRTRLDNDDDDDDNDYVGIEGADGERRILKRHSMHILCVSLSLSLQLSIRRCWWFYCCRLFIYCTVYSRLNTREYAAFRISMNNCCYVQTNVIRPRYSTISFYFLLSVHYNRILCVCCCRSAYYYYYCRLASSHSLSLCRARSRVYEFRRAIWRQVLSYAMNYNANNDRGA